MQEIIMDPQKVKRTAKKSRKSKVMNIRISPEISDWMKENDYSPTAIFYEALRQLKCPHR